MRTRSPRPADRHRSAPRPRAAAAARTARTVRARRAGGPQDRALYPCACGHASLQAVSTSVACPACGSPQDW